MARPKLRALKKGYIEDTAAVKEVDKCLLPERQAQKLVKTDPNILHYCNCYYSIE